MGRSPQRKPRQSSTPRGKKASRSWQRLQLMKGQQTDSEDCSNSLDTKAVVNDVGFKDVRTLQEKNRLLNWVLPLLYLSLHSSMNRRMHMLRTDANHWDTTSLETKMIPLLYSIKMPFRPTLRSLCHIGDLRSITLITTSSTLLLVIQRIIYSPHRYRVWPLLFSPMPLAKWCYLMTFRTHLPSLWVSPNS